jgi:hypothetical protein
LSTFVITVFVSDHIIDTGYVLFAAYGDKRKCMIVIDRFEIPASQIFRFMLIFVGQNDQCIEGRDDIMVRVYAIYR